MVEQHIPTSEDQGAGASQVNRSSGQRPGHRDGRFKIHGRKRGQLRPHESQWLAKSWPHILLKPAPDRNALLDVNSMPDAGRIVLEIGFGNGASLAAMAARHPEDLFIGIDVFEEGIVALLKRLDGRSEEEVSERPIHIKYPDGWRGGNVRLLREHAHVALENSIPDAALDRIVINFPDPWPKKRHHKRRLIQDDFLDLLAKKAVPGALLTLATDWAEYAEWMLEKIEPHAAYENVAGKGALSPVPNNWIQTNFELKGIRAGRTPHHLAYRIKRT